MSNWFTKLFSGKKCCQQTEEKTQPVDQSPMSAEPTPMAAPMEAPMEAPMATPENTQPENTPVENAPSDNVEQTQ